MTRQQRQFRAMKRRQINDVLRALDKLITGSVAMRFETVEILNDVRSRLQSVKEDHRAKNWK